jgi:hypothetical protein
VRKLFVLLLIAATASANEISYRSLQSGSSNGGTPIYDHGIHGEGQIVAVLDTGVDYDSCYFAESDRSAPPINTGTPGGGYGWTNIDTSRRKVIAYDFLYSCAQFPGVSGCDDPTKPAAYDNQGHGTHAAATILGDKGTPLAHDFGDAIALGAKLIVQDAGYSGGDNCSQRPGMGCPTNLTPILDQAYKQGARIHSNSWGDRQGTPPQFNPPTANYSASARDVDAFVYSHPDMLVVFNVGNFGTNATPPPSTLSAPGCAKNTLQVGGTRTATLDDNTITNYSLNGPSRDGRIKPDLVAPAFVLAGDTDNDNKTNNCNFSFQGGTSWASPSVAGAAALARQYYVDGYYPSGIATPSDRFTPSAALLKATMIAAARRVPYRWTEAGSVDTAPVPSYDQGFGFPVLDDALYFPGDRVKLKVVDVATDDGLAAGASSTFRFSVHAGAPLKVALVWTDPAGTPRAANDSTPELVNDLDLSVVAPNGGASFGNEVLHPGQPDRLNNVEVVAVATPVEGTYTITISAATLGFGARQGYALVVTGDVTPAATRGRVAQH